MAIFSDAKVEEIYNLLTSETNRKKSDDILIQYPTSSAEMLVPANTTIIPVNRRFNRKLKTICVSIPENGRMTLTNNNIQQMFFSNESGILEFPAGIYMEDVVIELTNAGPLPAPFSFRVIFSQV